jgi:hypothetical protein
MKLLKNTIEKYVSILILNRKIYESNQLLKSSIKSLSNDLYLDLKVFGNAIIITSKKYDCHLLYLLLCRGVLPYVYDSTSGE